MDRIDQLIRKCATALQDTARAQGARRRHRKEREAAAAVEYNQVLDRVMFNFPFTRREKRPDLDDHQFKQLHEAEMRHRTQLAVTLIVELNSDNDSGGSPEHHSLNY
jgi:hypothetical protein